MIKKQTLRENYIKLILDNKSIIDSLDKKDNKGKTIEFGYSLINKILVLDEKGCDISEQISIIGKDNWVRLKENWKSIKLMDNNI